MNQEITPAGRAELGAGDPWSIPARLLSGMILGAGSGWLVDQWLGTTFAVLVGLLAGTALAIYVIYLRLAA